jgi:hydroxymethylpyrimidine/phosphomethylpyrimidine kinase
MSVRPAVLTIAGSDSGGGAGIQADLKTFQAFGVHGASAIVAITAQNSREVSAVRLLDDDIIAAQIDAVMRDLQPEVVKLGMLGDARIVRLVAAKLREWSPRAIVLDPVMVASSGATLLEEEAIEAVRTLLIPIATIVTPNWLEAGVLINAYPRGLQDVERIAISFQRLGAQNLLLKGGHVEGAEVVDTFFDGTTYTQFVHRRFEGAEGHGTGCTLASAVAAGIARGDSLLEACRNAVEFVHRALRDRYATGSSKPNFLAVEPHET